MIHPHVGLVRDSFVGMALLLDAMASFLLYVAVALTFSSTIIIVKLLSDKREIDQLHGRIAVVGIQCSGRFIG